MWRAPFLGLIALLLIQHLGVASFARIPTAGAVGTLVATPEAVEAGTAIAVSGADFAPNEALDPSVITPYGQTLALLSQGGTPPTLRVGSAGGGGAVTADANGAFTFSLRTAANYQAGDWTVIVRGRDSGREQQGDFALSAPLVSAATLTPGASPIATPATPPARTTPAGEAAAPTPATPAPATSTPPPALTAAPIQPTAVATPMPTPAPSVPAPTAAPSGVPAPSPAPAPSAAPAPSGAPSAAPSPSPSPNASPSSSTAPGASPVPATSPGAAPAPTVSPTATPAPSPAPTAPAAGGFAPGAQVIVNSPTGSAAVRAQPAAAAVVRTVNSGTVLTIGGAAQDAEGHRWWPVAGAGFTGWIIADLIASAPATAPTTSPSTSPSASPAPAPAPAPTEIGPGVQVTVSSPANLRAEPSTSATILRTIASGTVLNVIGASQSADGYAWWPVQADGANGWIVAGLLVLVTTPAPGGSPSPGASTAPGTDTGTNGATPIIPPPTAGPAVAPSQLLPTFAAASALTGVPQEILLAIARVESNFTPSATGPFIPQLAGTENERALGMMQFLPGTYRMVMQRVDAATGKGLGMMGIWDAESAIYAAAFYLKDSGAPGDIRRALFAYNNANWYVELILSWASHYLGGAIPDPNLLDPSRTGGTPLAAPQNPLLPSNSRHLDMASPIQLYAPWTAGETWYVGGDGSFYGDGYHTDRLGNYYTVDFNKGTWPRSEEDDGAPILAAADGIVNNVYQDGAGAWVVELYHVAPDGSQLRTLYVHLKGDPRINPGIKVNQAVLHGTPIGLNGSTGNSTGSHLHFGLWILRDGQWMSIRPEPMEGQYLRNGLSIVSTNRPIASDTGARALEFGFAPAGPSNADKVTIVAAGRADGLPGARIDAYVNSARDGSDRGQWLPIGSVEGENGQIDWLTAPVAEGAYRLLFVQTDAAGNRTFRGLTAETAVRYTIRRGEPRAALVANPRADLTALIPLDGATLPALGGRALTVSGPLRFATPIAQGGSATLGAGAVVAATGAPPTGKVREAEGLLVEEATTNLVTNPSFERGAEGWTTRSAPENVATALPSDSALFGKRSLRIDNTKGTGPVILATTAGDGNAATWSVYARALPAGESATPGGSIALGMSGLRPQESPLTAEWQRIAFSGATGTAGTERQIIVPIGAIVELDGAQLEAKPYATSYADGALGSGYGWDRAADSSLSGRLPTAARLPLDGLIRAEGGALAFWATPRGSVTDGAVVFALDDRLTLTVAGAQATLRWDDETIATMPWERGVTRHYALTWDRSTLTFLRDGQIVGWSAVADFALPPGATLFLGSDLDGRRVINATFQDLALWQAAPTAETLATLASAGQFLTAGQDETVTLDVGLTLATQGLAPNGIKMQFSFDGTAWTEAEPFAPTKVLTLLDQPGEQRIYVRFTDEEGRTIVVTDRVELILPPKPVEDSGDGR